MPSDQLESDRLATIAALRVAMTEVEAAFLGHRMFVGDALIAEWPDFAVPDDAWQLAQQHPTAQLKRAFSANADIALAEALFAPFEKCSVDLLREVFERLPSHEDAACRLRGQPRFI